MDIRVNVSPRGKEFGQRSTSLAMFPLLDVGTGQQPPEQKAPDKSYTDKGHPRTKAL